jgi:hypothetical protein
MSTDVSSLKTKLTRADRTEGIPDGQNSKFKFPNHVTASNLPFTNGQYFNVEHPNHVTAPNFPFMSKFPRPSLPFAVDKIVDKVEAMCATTSVKVEG